MKHPEQEGKWQLVDGERRYTACKALVEEGNENFKTIPCTVREYGSAALAELQLILSNSTNRVLSNAEIMKQAEKTEMLFYQLKEEGYEFPGRMRDQVAAACQVSATKLAKLKVIREKLIPEYAYLWEKDTLTEQAAYALARMPVELQKRISDIYGAKPPFGHGAEKILKEWEEGQRWDASKLTCPDGRACGGSNRFLKHDLDNPWSMCLGEKCCLTCEMANREWSPYERMCSKAKDARKVSAEEKKRTREEEALFESEENKKATRENAKRLMRAIDAAGLDDEVKLRWRDYGVSYTVAAIRAYAEGTFGADLLRDVLFDPEELGNALDLVEQLQCSTDFLFGLTEELNPTGTELKWKNPKEPPVAYREVVAMFRLPGVDQTKRMIAKWDGEDWCFPSGTVIDAECMGWWPIPEEEA